MHFFNQSFIWPFDFYCVETKIAAFNERFKKPHRKQFWNNLLLGGPFNTFYLIFHPIHLIGHLKWKRSRGRGEEKGETRVRWRSACDTASLSSRSSTMNPVYSPVQPGAPYGNPKNMAYTGYPTGYPTAAPAYNPNMYPTSSPGYAPGYTAGTPYKVPPTQSNNAPPPYSPSPNPYQTAMYPIRSAYPQQNLYTQGAYYTQPVYAAQPHVIHHTTVVQPNSIPSAIYPAPVAAPRTNGVAMGMVAGTTMAMSAGTLLTTPQHTAIGAHPVSVPTYRAQGTPTYSYVPPHW
ncbi:protein FAM168A isoform X2 [Rissa tridactyla]|uniref:protein FAM168A isoform X2 n=2 Tax=Neoaves TaxID=3078114 RepID=UPI0023BA607D|nr:protein FAM168A isoform X2 [Rissa tridactyla]